MLEQAFFYISILVFIAGIYFLIVGLKARKKLTEVNKLVENYDNIINLANDAMLVIDIVDGKIHQANPSAAALLEYDLPELLNKSLFDLHPAEYLERSSNAVADTWEKGGLIFSDVPFITKTGVLIDVECSAKVAPFAGRPAVVIYARDIRERLLLEKEVTEQRRLVDEKTKDMKDSIEYSRRIQRSFMPDKELVRTFAPNAFIYFQPRDVVSGDFYWFINYDLKAEVVSETGSVNNAGSKVLVVAAADCTGHGVPGAFMSMIGNSLLDQTTRTYAIRSPAVALDFVNAGLKKHLNKNYEGQPLRDGMDISLCSINITQRFMEYAAANNPVYLIRNNELIVLAPEKRPLTASPDSDPTPFTNRIVPLEQGDCIYLFTDGYADQFGGEKGKKFLYKRFKELLVEIHQQDMQQQRTTLQTIFEDWKKDTEQVDDVLIIGIRID